MSWYGVHGGSNMVACQEWTRWGILYEDVRWKEFFALCCMLERRCLVRGAFGMSKDVQPFEMVCPTPVFVQWLEWVGVASFRYSS